MPTAWQLIVAAARFFVSGFIMASTAPYLGIPHRRFSWITRS